jgi:transcriptional regulator with XRE-family HTH domain
MNFGELLKKCRMAERYSLNSLRDEIKATYPKQSMSSTILTDYESGKSSPSAHRLAVLVTVLKMDPAAVIGAIMEDIAND